MFVTTINRTILSGTLAVFAAERIFRVVPVGAHDWNKFVTPDELQNILQNSKFLWYKFSGDPLVKGNHKSV